MRWLLVALAVALVIAIFLWVSGAFTPMQPTLPEIGPGARSTIPLDLSSSPD